MRVYRFIYMRIQLQVTIAIAAKEKNNGIHIHACTRACTLPRTLVACRASRKRQVRTREREREIHRLVLWVGGFSDWNMKNGIEVCIWHNGMCFQRVEHRAHSTAQSERTGAEHTLLFGQQQYMY